MKNQPKPASSIPTSSTSLWLRTKCPRLDAILGLYFHYTSLEWRAHLMIAAVMKIQIASDLHLEVHHDRYSPLLINECGSLVEAIGAQLWISGHVHDPHD